MKRQFILALVAVAALRVQAASDLTWNTIDGGGATFSTNGTVTLGGTIGQPDAGSMSSGTVSLVGGFWGTANYPRLVLTSQATADASPAVAGAPVQFSIPGGPDLVVSWNFGDGSPVVSGPTVSHIFATSSTFTVTATVSRPATGESVTSSQSVLVNAVGTGGGGGDADGDGFSDQLETHLGTSPSNAKETPLGTAPAGTPLPLLVDKFGIKLNFTKANSDAIVLSGGLEIPAGFVALGKKVTLDVGGVLRTFTLNAKGAQKSGNDRVKIGIKAKKGVVASQTAKYQFKLSKGNFDAALADEGLTPSGYLQKMLKTVRVDLFFNGQLYQNMATPIYIAKLVRRGVGK